MERFEPPRNNDWKPKPMRVDVSGRYVLYSEARADIARLEKEVERLAFDNKAKSIQIEMHSGMAEGARQQRDTAWNDAIEAAAKITDPHSDRTAEKIRALKRPT